MSAIRPSRFVGAFALAALAAGAVQATELTWYGQSAFKIVTPSGKVLLVDPWIVNPVHPAGKETLEKLDRVDLILLTHGHGDHIGNSVDIARKTGAKLVASFDLSKAMVQYRGFPKDQAGMPTAGHVGGQITLLDGDVRIGFTPALHGSDIEVGPGMPNEGSLQAAGNPGGFVIDVKDGPAIYHAGDTDVFSDMALVNLFRQVDVFLAPIGDKFTMGPKRAALAARLVNPTTAVVPMHFGTFPALTGTPAAFQEALRAQGVNAPMRELKPGETVKF